jgi:hypothetical protein
MLRRLFTILSALSLLLCVAVCLLWVRSYWVNDSFACATAVGGSRAVGSNSGHLVLMRQSLTAGSTARVTTPTGYRSAAAGRDGGSMRPSWSFLGFRYTGLRFFGVVAEALEVPYWAVALPTAAFPLTLLYVRRFRHMRRRRLALCPSCGYDLRATPGRCPECGARRPRTGNGGQRFGMMPAVPDIPPTLAPVLSSR